MQYHDGARAYWTETAYRNGLPGWKWEPTTERSQFARAKILEIAGQHRLEFHYVSGSFYQQTTWEHAQTLFEKADIINGQPLTTSQVNDVYSALKIKLDDHLKTTGALGMPPGMAYTYMGFIASL